MKYKEKLEERGINIRDLLWTLIAAWKFIVLFIIIFSALLGIWKYAGDKKSAANAQTIKADTNITDELSEEEQQAVEKAKDYQTQIAERQKYLDESILMNLNPYEKNVVVLQYYVDTGYQINVNEEISKDYINEIIQTYKTCIANDGMQNELAEKLDWNVKPVYIGELLAAFGDTDDAGTFSVVVSGEDATKAEELADQVEEFLVEYQDVVSEKIGEHDLTLVSRYDAVIVDNSLAVSRFNVEKYIDDLSNGLDALIADFNEIQLAEYEGEENVQTTQNVQTTAKTSVSVNKKYVLLGGIVGLFISCVWIILKYMLSGKLRSKEEIQELFGLRVLGSLERENSEKNFRNPIDRKIEICRKHEHWDADEQRKFVASNLKMACRKNGLTQLYITTSLQRLDEKELQEIQALLEELRIQGIEAAFGENIVYDVENFEQMAANKNVVLVEKVGNSEFVLIEKEMVMCEEQGLNLVGTIVIE